MIGLIILTILGIVLGIVACVGGAFWLLFGDVIIFIIVISLIIKIIRKLWR